jgi:protein CpxP
MDLLSRNRVLTACVVLLVLLNLAVLGTFWWKAGEWHGPAPSPAAGPKELMERELQMSESQQKQFEELRETFQKQTEPIVSQLRRAREELFGALRTGDMSDPLIARKAEEIGTLQGQLEMITFRHFQSLRAPCDERQQKRLDELIRGLFGRGGGQPPPPPGPPPGGRPGEDSGPGGERFPGPPPPGARQGEPPPR